MAAVVKQVKSRFVRWIKDFKKNNEARKWYEHDHCGLH